MDIFFRKESAETTDEKDRGWLADKEEKVVKQKRRNYETMMKTLMYISTLLTGGLVIFLISYVLIKGIPNLSIEFLTTKPSYITEKIGILPDILNTPAILPTS